MNYKGFEIEQDTTGYAPDHLKFGFFDSGGECQGMGKSIENGKSVSLSFKGLEPKQVYSLILKHIENER